MTWTSRFALSKNGVPVDTEPWCEEACLFVTPFRAGAVAPAKWAKRCDSWLKHVNMYACIAAGLPTDCDHPSLIAGTRDRRIQFLYQHLNVLDTKVGIVLTFNSLLLIAMNVLLGILYNAAWHSQTRAHALASWMFWAFVVSLVLFAITWITIAVVTLFAFGRVVWGDLYQTTEEEHVKQLIIAVARRTNKFRAAIPLTIANVLLVVAAAIFTGLLRSRFG